VPGRISAKIYIGFERLHDLDTGEIGVDDRVHFHVNPVVGIRLTGLDA
jgi:hypothetical protein